jgi:hypothetical protein
VHLPSEYARLLFNEAPLGMTVVVTNRAHFPEPVTHPAFLSPLTADGKVQVHERLSSSEKYRWKPEAAPEGPVSMLISRSDKRMVVLRNGVEIGRSRISVASEADSLGTHVYVAHANTVPAAGTGSIQWLSHQLSDVHYGKSASADYASALSRIKIPDPFLVQIQPLLVEGTTLMVTDAPILRKTSGKEMAVMSSSPEN